MHRRNNRDMYHHRAGLRVLQDFSKLVNNPRLHNVAFLCQDKKVIYAVKEMLAARSGYFETLLFGEMKEAFQDVVHLPTVLSSYLLLVFEFLHCGKLTLPDNPDPELILGVYELAMYYDLVELEDELLKVMPAMFDQANVGTVLMFASQFNAPKLEKLALDFFSRMKPQTDMFMHFTEEALIRALSHSSLARQQVNSQAAFDIFFDAILGWGRARMEIESPETPSCSSSGMGASAPCEELGKVLENVLAAIDLEKLHVFESVAERKDVANLLPMLQQVQMYRTLMACPWDDLHCGPGVTVQKSATGWNRWRTLACSYCSSTAGVSAVGTHSFVSGVYEWALGMETSCMNLWVGLVPAGLKLDSSMAYEESAWCISGGYKYSPPTSSGFRALEHRDMCYGPPLGAAGQRVVMRVDMTKHECSFTIDGVDYGVAFSQLPNEPLYPAVSFGAPGKVRFLGYSHSDG